MRRLIFQVAVGEVPAFYETCMDSMRAYAARIGADYKCATEPVLRIVPKKSQRSENALRLGYLPIFEKEQGFAYLGEYDQVAIIDADVYARPCAPDIFVAAAGHNFAAVKECALPLKPQYVKKVRNYSRDQYGTYDFPFYNMGVMVFDAGVPYFLKDQAPKEFIERQEFEKFVNGEGKYRWSTDQTLLNTWVHQSSMVRCDLNWRWNCIYDYVTDAALLDGPFFVHFNLASKMPRGGAEIPEIIARLA